MKIIEAARDGELAIVKLKGNGITVTLEKQGELRVITSQGKGNVRSLKEQAKAISAILHA
ncbi:hypothetical protein [Ewingella americana]